MLSHDALVRGRYRPGVRMRVPDLSAAQLAVVESTVTAVGTGGFDDLRESLGRSARDGVWLPPPVLAVAAALIAVAVEPESTPLELDEGVWDAFLSECRPQGRSEWRNANYALHAAGCLAGGVWLDVARQESFWQLPLWPFAVDVVELLTKIAQGRLGLPAAQLAAAVGDRVGLSADASRL